MSLVQNAIQTFKHRGLKTFVKKILRFIIQLIYLPVCRPKIKRFKTDDLDELIDFTFTVDFEFIKPVQVRYEIRSFLELLKKEKPKTIVEIGTARGGTLFLDTRVASEDAVLVSIDLPYTSSSGGYHFWQKSLYKSFALPSQQIHLIQSDSHDKKTVEEVERILNGKKVDFLFIDGDHSYDGVKKDFEMYSPLVKKNGIIAFHDIVVHPPEINCKVNELWDEIKLKHKYKEFVEDWNQKYGGIGAIIKKELINQK